MRVKFFLELFKKTFINVTSMLGIFLSVKEVTKISIVDEKKFFELSNILNEEKVDWKIFLLIFITFYLSSFLFYFMKYHLKGIKVKGNSSSIRIIFGDIFNEDKHEGKMVIIPIDKKFSDNFSGVDKISNKSIQNQFINMYKNEYSNARNEDSPEKRHVINVNEIKYYLFPIVTLNKKYVAKIRLDQLINKYYQLCEIISENSKKKEVIVPLIGSGIKKNPDMTFEENLALFIQILKTYNFSRNGITKITIVLNRDTRKLNDLDVSFF